MPTPTPTLTLSHTATDGTLIDGTRKGDGTADHLRASPLNWRWSRDLGSWYVRGSRDHKPRLHDIQALATALRGAGWDVDVDITATARPTADVEADRVERSAGRVDALDAKAGRLIAAGDAGWDAARERASHIPMGQPILVGHHSEARHRRELARIDSMEGRAVAQITEGRDAGHRSTAAEANQRHHVSGPATLRRIEKLEADARGYQRWLDGYTRTLFTFPDGRKAVEEHAAATGAYRDRAETLLAEAEEQLTYWRAHIAALEEAGTFRVWSRSDFTKGDFVAFRFGWAKVLRVNAKSLTIPHVEERLAAAGMTWKLPYDDVRGQRSAEEPAAAAAQEG